MAHPDKAAKGWIESVLQRDKEIQNIYLVCSMQPTHMHSLSTQTTYTCTCTFAYYIIYMDSE